MSALVGYDSSDDDDHLHESSNFDATTEPAPSAVTEDSTSNGVAVDKSASPVGPVAGPAMAVQHQSGGSPPESPQSTGQDTVMNLTLPPIPDFNIPASPSGSPNLAAVTKLDQFAALKKEGVHFNERLAGSSAIQNPGLLSKLMDSFGLNSEDQYATILPDSTWNPSALPAWSYKEQLLSAQTEVSRDKQRVDFVVASGQISKS